MDQIEIQQIPNVPQDHVECRRNVVNSFFESNELHGLIDASFEGDYQRFLAEFYYKQVNPGTPTDDNDIVLRLAAAYLGKNY